MKEKMRFNLSFQDKPFEVVGMGLNSVDFLTVVPKFPALNSKMRISRFSKQGGGQVATALVALSRWGLKTKYIGRSEGMSSAPSLSTRYGAREWRSLQ